MSGLAVMIPCGPPGSLPTLMALPPSLPKDLAPMSPLKLILVAPIARPSVNMSGSGPPWSGGL
eukprot:15446400-Alexandrium_andersonii.AAC.1